MIQGWHLKYDTLCLVYLEKVEVNSVSTGNVNYELHHFDDNLKLKLCG